MRLHLFLVDLHMPVNDLLKRDSEVRINATLRVFCGEEKLFGPGKLELLQHIQETGSISQAAKKMALFLTFLSFVFSTSAQQGVEI